MKHRDGPPRKIFLVHPTYDSNPEHTLVYRKGYGSAIPLGLAYVAAYLIERGHRVKIYDFQVEDTDFFAELSSFDPDVVGISVTTPTANASARLAGQIRERRPGTPIIAGGPHATTLRERMLEESAAYDYLVVGEGETTTFELVEALGGARPVEEIPGVCLRMDGTSRFTGERPFLDDLDGLPRLPVELFHFKRYVPTPGTFVRLPNVAFLSTRGCPFHCVFCNKSMFGNTLRQMSARRMVEEILHLKARFGVREINFFDDTFTVDKARVFEFCRLLTESGANVGWKCNSRVNTVTREMLFAMKKAGCFSISFGVESGDDAILKNIRKGITTAQVRDAFRWSREAGILRAAFFMINLPGDTRETVEKTIAFSREIDPDFVSFELLKPLPGTRIREALEGMPNLRIDEGLWNDWDSCTVANKVFFTQNDLTRDYLEDAFERAVKRFYLRPAYVWRAVRRLRSFAQFKSYAAAALNILSAKVSKAH